MNLLNYSDFELGYKNVFFTPQLSFTQGKFTVYATRDFPVYQYLNTSPYYTQIGSQNMTTVGLSYRFFAVRSIVKAKDGTADYVCTMHPDVTSSKLGRCPKCGMELEKFVKK